MAHALALNSFDRGFPDFGEQLSFGLIGSNSPSFRPSMPTFPLLCQSLILKNLFRCHVSFGKRQVCFNISQPEPHVSLHIVPLNSLPIQIEHSQVVSPLSRASPIRVVLGGFSVPFGCQRIVWVTPSPYSYICPSEVCASGSPCSADFLNHFNASGKLLFPNQPCS